MTPATLALVDASGSGVPFIVIGLWILFLAIFTGFELITKVPPTLHTPLMSGEAMRFQRGDDCRRDRVPWQRTYPGLWRKLVRLLRASSTATDQRGRRFHRH